MFLKIVIRRARLLLVCIMIIILTGCQLSGSNEFDPETAAMARLKLGLAYLNKIDESAENVNLAHYNISRANEYSPDNPNIMLVMALFDQKVGENGEAELIYKRITEMAPSNGLYAIHYANFLCANNRYTEAQANFQKVIDLDSYYKWKIDVFEQYGYCAIQNKDNKQADIMFEQLFKADASRRESVRKEAQIYKDKGDTRMANYLFKVAN